MELEIVKTDWDGLIPSLQSGAIDLVIAGMSPTPERMEVIDFTDNYYTSDFVIVVKKMARMPMRNPSMISKVPKSQHNKEQLTIKSSIK